MRGLLQDYSSKLDRKNPNLAPLIDVVFQLILFFLVTSSFTWYSGMKVRLPEATTAMIDQPIETVTLEIKRGEDESDQPERLTVLWREKQQEQIGGELFWPPKEGKDPAIGLSLLSEKLSEHKALLEKAGEDPQGKIREPSIIIAAEDSVPYQIVITVIDMCEQLGFSDIVLAIQRKTPPNQTET